MGGVRAIASDLAYAQMVHEGELEYTKVNTKENMADLCTKNLPKADMEKITAAMSQATENSRAKTIYR